MRIKSLRSIDLHRTAGGAVAGRWSGCAGRPPGVSLCCRRERRRRDRDGLLRIASGGSRQHPTEPCLGEPCRLPDDSRVVKCARGPLRGSELHGFLDHDHRVRMLGPGLEAVGIVEQQHRVEPSLLRRFADQVLRLVFLYRVAPVDPRIGGDTRVDEQPHILRPLRLTAELRTCEPEPCGPEPCGPCKTEPVSDSDAENRLGDPTVFDAFYRAHAESLLRYFYRRTDDPDVAADLCAETFAAALINSGQFDSRRGDTTAWLYGIARRRLAMYWRRRKVADRARKRLGIPREPIDEDSAHALLRTEDILDSSAALAALEELPPKLRQAVRLRVIDQLEYATIAAQLDCSEHNVRVRVSRGLHQLAGMLQ